MHVYRSFLNRSEFQCYVIQISCTNFCLFPSSMFSDFSLEANFINLPWNSQYGNDFFHWLLDTVGLFVIMQHSKPSSLIFKIYVYWPTLEYLLKIDYVLLNNIYYFCCQMAVSLHLGFIWNPTKAIPVFHIVYMQKELLK